jgi:hypothetical protein
MELKQNTTTVGDSEHTIEAAVDQSQALHTLTTQTELLPI